MSQVKVKAIQFGVEQVGKHIKATKKRYLWALSIATRYLQLILQDSLVTGKKKLSINGKIFHETQTQKINKLVFIHQFLVDGVHFNITEGQSTYELRINNVSFSHMVNQEMKKSNFQDEKGDQHRFQLDQKLKSQNQRVKLNLNIPGMAISMKKKKTNSSQSDNWNQFVGGSSFPNYFGQNQTENKAEITNKAPLIQQKCPQQKMVTEQFNKMQNIFKTTLGVSQGMLNEQKVQITNEPVAAIYSISEIPMVNQQEFNTMQNLFLTNTNTQITTSSNQQPEKQNTSTSILKTSVPQDNFNTMQNMFSTLKIQNKTNPLPSKIVDINLNDFNTMQDLFKTNALPPLPQTINQAPQHQEFTTVQQTLPITPPIQFSNLDLNNVDINNFNTMQHLFSTNSLNLSEMMNPNALSSTSKHNQAQPQPAFGKSTQTSSIVNVNDFNNMQNLFKTGVFGVNMGQDKKENQFWKF